jgi:integrase
MAHIRKRSLPSGKVRWQVIWLASDKRASEMFDTQREANAKRIAIESQKPSSSAPFRQLAADYVAHMEALVKNGTRERSYLAMLRSHIDNHILTDREFSGGRCCSIGTPEVQLFLNRMIGRISSKSAVKVRTTLAQVFKFGTQVGYAAANPVRDAEIQRKRRPDAGEEAPFSLPSKAELKALIDGAVSFDNNGRAEAVVRVLAFGGLRMSELRGLPRDACTLVGERPSLSIRQRADRYNVIGSVKSAAGRRVVDLGPDTAQALRLWLMAAPLGKAAKDSDTLRIDFAFPNESGGVWGYPNFRSRFWVPLMNHCGLVTDQPADSHIRGSVTANADFMAPAFSPHTLRHVYASLQIEQGVSPKRLQKLIGHATLKMTLDTYGHLWPDEDADRARARGVERMI